MPMKPVFIDEKAARRSLAILMGRAHFGQEFVLTRDGVPFARLIPNSDKNS